MQNINTYIVEKLRINDKLNSGKKYYHPKDNAELRELIQEIVKNTEDRKFIDLTNIDVSSINDFHNIFLSKNNEPLVETEELDLSNWDVSNGKDMHCMFQGCLKLKKAHIEDWDVSKVLNMQDMFLYCGNYNENISKWNTKSVVSMTGMFYGCSKFCQDLSNWDIGNVQAHRYTFTGTPIEHLKNMQPKGWRKR